MIEIRAEFPHDVPARERLLDVCFPGNRRAKTSERLREGRLPARGSPSPRRAAVGSSAPFACGMSRRARAAPHSCSGRSPWIRRCRARGSAR